MCRQVSEEEGLCQEALLGNSILVYYINVAVVTFTIKTVEDQLMCVSCTLPLLPQ